MKLSDAKNMSPDDRRAYESMAYDIIENLLKSAGNPGNVGDYLTSQLMELTGAGIIAMFQFDEFSGHRLFSFKPARKTKLAESAELRDLSEILKSVENVTLWNYSDTPGKAETLLSSISCGLSIGVPLRFNDVFLGSILVLNLPSEFGIDLVVKALEMLSTATALIFRNALLYLKQEEIIESRTATLKENERKLNTLIEHLPGVVYRSRNADFFEKEYLSRKCKELTGYSEDIFTSESGISFKDIIHPDDIDTIKSQVFLAVQNKTDYEINYRIHTASHKEKWLWDKGSAFYSDTGDVVAYEGFIVDITEKFEAREALRKSEERFIHLAENADEWIWEIDSDGLYTYCSPAVERILGYTPEEMAGKMYIWDTFDKEMQPHVKEKTIGNYSNTVPLKNYEIRNRHRNGDMVILETNAVPVLDKSGRLTGYQGTNTNITKRKTDEETIRKSLEEKEMLLREIYHRTKNNMQVMYSFLMMKASMVNNEETREILNEMANRILIMALVHEKLYQSQNLSKVNLKEYITELIRLLLDSFKHTAGKVSVHEKLDNIEVFMDTAVPCGLIINEVISNALKYAFPGNRSGDIFINLNALEDRLIELEISDNGIGLPPDMNLRELDTIGTKIIFAVVEIQLNGKADYFSGNGVTWRFQYRDTLYEERV